MRNSCGGLVVRAFFADFGKQKLNGHRVGPKAGSSARVVSTTRVLALAVAGDRKTVEKDK